MSNVCADPCSLAPDDRGVLRVNIAGDPDPQPWPYLCALSESNLERDTDCLWVDPIARNDVLAVVGRQSPNTTINPGSSSTIVGLANLVVFNPDPCRAATALITITMGWVLDAGFDPDTQVGYFSLLRQITGAGVPADGGYVESYKNHIGSRTTAVVRYRTQQVISSIAAGGSANVGLDLRVTVPAGGSPPNGPMIWTQAYGNITAMVTSG